MKDTLYKVWFNDGHIESIYAGTAKEAGILAQAKAINDGRPFDISSIQNQENGYTFSYSVRVQLLRG